VKIALTCFSTGDSDRYSWPARIADQKLNRLTVRYVSADVRP